MPLQDRLINNSQGFVSTMFFRFRLNGNFKTIRPTRIPSRLSHGSSMFFSEFIRELHRTRSESRESPHRKPRPSLILATGGRFEFCGTGRLAIAVLFFSRRSTASATNKKPRNETELLEALSVKCPVSRLKCQLNIVT